MWSPQTAVTPFPYVTSSFWVQAHGASVGIKLTLAALTRVTAQRGVEI